MHKKVSSGPSPLKIGIFTLSLICLFITMRLFGEISDFVEEHNSSFPSIGISDLGLILTWLRLFFAILLTFLSIVNLFED